jgi:Ca2+/H+ antiporter
MGYRKKVQYFCSEVSRIVILIYIYIYIYFMWIEVTTELQISSYQEQQRKL